ncbi:MAG: Uma2 family endonuclease [Methylovulum sp.]|nr:Uma2 family endonuclease [Methylovulum sp.]
MNTVLKTQFDPAAYLEWEETQDEKHEYIAGEVFAMAGARREHVVVTLNLAAAFKQALRGSRCQAYAMDLKLWVEQVDAFYYPDVMVSCSAQDHAAEQYLSQPVLIVEVLSDSTAAYDRGNKFAAYRTLESLKEYVIIDIPSRRVECYRRTPENEWLLHDYLADELCPFPSLGVSMPLSEIFENVVSPEID